jgi:hypothetical protein
MCYVSAVESDGAVAILTAEDGVTVPNCVSDIHPFPVPYLVAVTDE